jgi:hypothetical protein
MGATDSDGVIARYGTGQSKKDFNRNFRDDGKRFDFSINSSQFASCELYGYFALDNPHDDECSGKMGGGKHSGSNDVKCYDIGVDLRNGATRYRTENPHPNYSAGKSGGQGKGMNSRFQGYLFVKRNVSGAVILEFHQDSGDNETRPSNQWVKVSQWRVTSPLWQTPGSDHQETIRIDGPNGVPNLKFKWLGVREILSGDPETPSGAVPGGGTGTPTTPTPGTPAPVIDQGVDLGTITFIPLDLNGDGVTEAYDGNRDGRADGYDTNNDGIIDALDVYGTGRPNAFDTDGDGITDAYDTNADGIIDKRGGGPGLNTSGPGGINSPDGSSAPPAPNYVTKKLKVMWTIDTINVDACSVTSPFETQDPQKVIEAAADNIYADTLNYRKIGMLFQEVTVSNKKEISALIGKRIRKVEVTFKKFGIGSLTGLIYCRIRSANGTIVEEFTTTVDSAALTNVDVVKTYEIATPQRTIEKGDILYIEFPEGGDPANYLRVKITNTDKADGAMTCLVTDDGAKTSANVDKDLACNIYV